MNLLVLSGGLFSGNIFKYIFGFSGATLLYRNQSVWKCENWKYLDIMSSWLIDFDPFFPLPAGNEPKMDHKYLLNCVSLMNCSFNKDKGELWSVRLRYLIPVNIVEPLHLSPPFNWNYWNHSSWIWNINSLSALIQGFPLNQTSVYSSAVMT